MTETFISWDASQDNTSCFVPAYGFQTAEQATAFVESPIAGDSDGMRYAPVLLGGKFPYVPTVGRYERTGNTDEMMGTPRVIGGKPIWETIRRAGEPKPEGSYNVALLVSGRRQFNRYYRSTAKHRPFWYRMNTGDRDCYSLWLPTKGGAMLGPDTAEARVFASRSARGVIYAEEQQFDDHGEPHEVLTTIVGKEFSIMDRDSNRDACIRWSASFRLVDWSKTAGDPLRGVEGLDAGWHHLFETARQRFRTHCRSLPEDTARWREWFVEQRRQAHKEGYTFDGSSFKDSIKGLDWQDALRRVEHAWQLQVVIRDKCGSEFDDCPQYCESTSRRWGKMISRHDCCPTRRDQLKKMVHDFVAPSDNIWNYCGD